MVIHTGNPRTAGTGGSQVFMTSQSSWIGELLVWWGTLPQKVRWREAEEDSWCWHLAPTCILTHIHAHRTTYTCLKYMFSKAKQQQQQKLQQCGEADWAHLYPRVPFPHWQDSSLLLYFWIFGCLILQPVWFLLSSQGVSHSCVYLFDDCSRNLLLRTLLGVGDTNIHSDRSPSWETSASSACWRFDSTCNRLFPAGAVFSPLSQVCSKEDSVCTWIDAFCREMLCIRWWAQGYRWGTGVHKYLSMLTWRG